MVNAEGPKKGQATPSRKAAEAARKQSLKPERGSKAAKQMQRDRDSQNRIATRIAMYTNDEKHLPLRDRGTVRRYVRDFVDRQVSVGELFVPVAFLVMILLFIPNAAVQQMAMIGWYLMFIALLVDGIILGFRIRRALRRDLPDESHRGAINYAVMRSVTLRSMRMPKPMVKVGGQPRPVKLPKSLVGRV